MKKQKYPELFKNQNLAISEIYDKKLLKLSDGSDNVNLYVPNNIYECANNIDYTVSIKLFILGFFRRLFFVRKNCIYLSLLFKLELVKSTLSIIALRLFIFNILIFIIRKETKEKFVSCKLLVSTRL